MIHVITITEGIDVVLRNYQLRLKRIHHEGQRVDQVLGGVRSRAVHRGNRSLRAPPELHEALEVIESRAFATGKVAVRKAHKRHRYFGLRDERVEHDLMTPDRERRGRPVVGRAGHLGVRRQDA